MKPFRVGETIALTPGAVIHRTPMYELIQYAPSTATVRQRPTIVIPPQINRFYFLDLAPGRSFVEHAVSQGIQTFLIAWRNPGPDQRTWGIDDYSAACIEALRIAQTITGADRVNVAGFCSGGMTESVVLSHLASSHDDLIAGATLAVTMLDTEVHSTLNMFASTRSVSSATKKSARKGVLDGRSMNRMFAWVRPNDLVWNYWVSNYLLGEEPPAFDVHGLEQRPDQYAGQAARGLHGHLAGQRAHHARRLHGAGHADRSAPGQERPLCRGRHHRPSGAVDVGLRSDPGVRGGTCGSCCPTAVTSRR